MPADIQHISRVYMCVHVCVYLEPVEQVNQLPTLQVKLIEYADVRHVGTQCCVFGPTPTGAGEVAYGSVQTSLYGSPGRWRQMFAKQSHLVEVESLMKRLVNGSLQMCGEGKQ